jgi:hypothetical protein
MKHFVLSALVGALLTYSQASLAIDLYHCGNVYQDAPCRGADVNNSTSEKPVPVVKNRTLIEKKSAPATNPDCTQRGETAKNIAKLRESGKTEDQLLTELQIKDNPDTKVTSLIRDVYKRRGTSLQIQYVIEHECLQLLEKNRLTKKQMAESEKLRGNAMTPTNSKPSNPTKPQAEQTPVNTVKTEQAHAKPIQAEQTPVTPLQTVQAPAKPAQAEQTLVKPVQTEQATSKNKPAQETQAIQQTPDVQITPIAPAPTPQATKTEVKQHDQGDELGICSVFKTGLDNINSQIKKGGDAALMKDLKQQKSQLKQEMKSSGC